MPACIFCDIAGGKVKSDILYRDDHVFVIRDINPKAPTHLLIIPTDHVAALASLTPAAEQSVGHMLLVAQEMARREGVAEGGYRLVINQGADSGSEVAHLHMHLLGGNRVGAMG